MTSPTFAVKGGSVPRPMQPGDGMAGITEDDVRKLCAALIAERVVLNVRESRAIAHYRGETPVKDKPHFKIEIAPDAIKGSVLDRLNKIAGASGFTFSVYQGGNLVP